MLNITEIRKNFPTVNNLIYLDHAAVAPVHLRTHGMLDQYINHFLNKGISDYIV